MIKEGQTIDYYILYHPKMVKAYYESINGKEPIEPLANNLSDHIESVIKETNRIRIYML